MTIYYLVQTGFKNILSRLYPCINVIRSFEAIFFTSTYCDKTCSSIVSNYFCIWLWHRRWTKTNYAISYCLIAFEQLSMSASKTSLHDIRASFICSRHHLFIVLVENFLPLPMSLAFNRMWTMKIFFLCQRHYIMRRSIEQTLIRISCLAVHKNDSLYKIICMGVSPSFTQGNF